MKIFKVGDTQKAACEVCKSIENATFALRDVPFSDGHGMVKNVLAGVCDRCHNTILVPQQSVPAIKKQLETRRKPVESRVPAHMVDILNLASSSLGSNPDFSSTLIKYYVHTLSQEKMAIEGLLNYLQSDLAKGHAQKRISLKGRMVANELNHIKALTHIDSTTAVLKAVVLKINDDVLVKRNEQVINELKSVAAAFV